MNWRARGLLIRGLAGALLGVLVAWVILEESPREGAAPLGKGRSRKRVQPGDVVKLLTSAAVFVRQVADMRSRSA